MVSILVERFKAHQGRMVGIGTDAEGRMVAFATDRATYLTAAPLLLAGGPVGVEVEGWRVIATRERQGQ